MLITLVGGWHYSLIVCIEVVGRGVSGKQLQGSMNSLFVLLRCPMGYSMIFEIFKQVVLIYKGGDAGYKFTRE